jgi:hypothetical protein
LSKLALRGSDIQVGDILSSVWFFPAGVGEVVSLVPYEGKSKEFAGVGSQVATIKDCSYTVTLCYVDWWIVERNIYAE